MKMKINPILSFVIPVYNSEVTLRECVNSILNQGEENIEIILVDDGSKEICKNLCDIIAMENENTVYTIHKENGGSLSARIAGAKKAKGSYIVYVDADDVIMEKTLELIKYNIKNFPADIYLYDYLMDSIDKSFKKMIKLFPYDKIKFFGKDNRKEVYISFMDGKLNNMATTVVSKELLVKSFQLDFLNKIVIGEDRLQKLILLKYAKKIVYIPEVFYYYRWNSNSQSSNLRKNKINKNLYNDFKIVWKYERENYKILCLNKEEREKYDLEKVIRVCSIVENVLLDNSCLWNRKDKKNFFFEIVQDDFFIELLKNIKIGKERRYIRNLLRLLKIKNYLATFIYLNICKGLRKIKYRRKTN